jgi:hypothetical protein
VTTNRCVPSPSPLYEVEPLLPVPHALELPSSEQVKRASSEDVNEKEALCESVVPEGPLVIETVWLVGPAAASAARMAAAVKTPARSTAVRRALTDRLFHLKSRSYR